MAEVYGIVLRNCGGFLCAALFCFTIVSKVLLMQRASFVSTSSPSLRALGAIGRSLAALPDFTCNSRDRSTMEILHNNHLNMAEPSEVPAPVASQDVQLRIEQPVAGSGEVCSVPSTV
jgi:hypothetical protein